MTGGCWLPLADRDALNLFTNGTHWGLNALLTAVMLVGLFLERTLGDSAGNPFSVLAVDPRSRALADQVQDVHATPGWLTLALAALRAGAALVHSHAWHDGVLGGLLPCG